MSPSFFLRFVLVKHLFTFFLVNGEERERSFLYNAYENRTFHCCEDMKKVFKVADRVMCAMRCAQSSDWCYAVNFLRSTDGKFDSVCEMIHVEKNTNICLEETLVMNNESTFMIPEAPVKNKTCSDIQRKGEKVSGVYPIFPACLTVDVFCDLVTGRGGWTVIQRRLDGSEDFYRDWADYKRGFGNKSGEYWLGLDNIHEMTSRGEYELRVDMEDFEGETRYAVYGRFIVGDEASKYLLTIGQYSGNADDSLTEHHNNSIFSTKDRRDNDCALKYHGGWWYRACHSCNPNGLYLGGQTDRVAEGVTWVTWRGNYYSMKRIELKVRPKN